MPHYDEEYKGHQISIDTTKRGTGYVWSYQIDGGELRESRDRPMDEEWMHREALDDAKRRIGAMGK